MSSPPRTSRTQAALASLVFSYAAIGILIVRGFVLTPLCLRSVPLSEFGGWLALLSVATLIGLVDPGIGLILRQRVAFTFGKGEAGLPAVIGTGLVAGALMAPLPLLFWPATAPIVDRLGDWPVEQRAALVECVQLVLVNITVSLLWFVVSAVNDGLNLTRQSGLSNVVGGAASVACTIALLLSGAGLRAMPIGMIVYSAVAFLGNAWSLRRWYAAAGLGPPVFERAELRRLAGLAGFNSVVRVGAAGLGQLDAMIAVVLVSPESAAVLALTGRACDMVRLLSDRLGPVLMPGLAQLAGAGRLDDLERLAARLLRVVGWLAAIGLGGAVALNEAFVGLWVGPPQYGGGLLTLLCAAVVGAAVPTGAMFHVLYALGAVRRSSGLLLLEACLRLPLQVALIRPLGIAGVPAGALIAATVSGLVSAWLLALRLSRGGSLAARLWGAQALRVAFCGAAGGLAHWALARAGVHWTWPTFLVAAAAVALALGGLALLVDPALRAEAGVLAPLLRRKRDAASRPEGADVVEPGSCATAPREEAP